MNEVTAETQDATLSNEVQLTADIVSAFVGGGNTVAADDLPNLISRIHSTLTGLGGAAEEETKQEPAVAPNRSVKPDYIICLEDGKKLKMLKRHLNVAFGMTPDQYRAKWGLPADYPMVAPNYAETRRELAKKIGLGTKRTRTPNAEASSDASPKKATSTAKKATGKKRGRPAGSKNKPKAAAK